MISSAVLLAIGVRTTGHREVLGVSVALSEHEVHWRDFLGNLKDRGLHGVKLFISDAHEGLKAARNAIFPTVPWQRCQFHLQQNAQQYVPRQPMKQEVAERIRAIFTAQDNEEALRLLNRFLDDYQKDAPALVKWAETAVPEGLVVMTMPKAHRRRLRTVNPLERLNREILRRTRVATLFPDMAVKVNKEKESLALIIRFCCYVCIPGQRQRRDPVATFDHSDIRGLVTA